MEMKLSSPFTFGDRVILDGDSSLIARVTAVLFRYEYCQIEIAWLHNGSSYSAYVDNWRLSPAPETCK